MILDADTLELRNAIETMLEPAPTGEIKPELMESVLEISTDPCPDIAVAGAQLRALRGQVIETARGKQLTIGSAGTHPFAKWEDQRIVARPRYRDLISALRFVARQELIFGMHVHVGIVDLRRLRQKRCARIAHGLRIVDRQFDLVGNVLGFLLARRHHRRQRLADKSHDTVGKHRLPDRPVVELVQHGQYRLHGF